MGWFMAQHDAAGRFLGQQETWLLLHEKPSAGGLSWYAGDAVAWAGRRAEMTARVMGDETIGSVL